MRCGPLLPRGERFAIEALAKSLDAVRYDLATFAEHLLDDEGGEVPLVRPCLILRRDIPDFRWQRWTAVEEKPAASEHHWITKIRDIAETDADPDLQSRQPPLATIPRPRCPIGTNPAIPPVDRMDAGIVCNGITACSDRRA